MWTTLAQLIDEVNNARQKKNDEAVIQNEQNRKEYKENRSRGVMYAFDTDGLLAERDVLWRKSNLPAWKMWGNAATTSVKGWPCSKRERKTLVTRVKVKAHRDTKHCRGRGLCHQGTPWWWMNKQSRQALICGMKSLCSLCQSLSDCCIITKIRSRIFLFVSSKISLDF